MRIYRRFFNGEGYCDACYYREFKHKPCVKCGQIYRLPYRQKDVVCDRCKKNRPCLRCGKEQYSIGKLTQYGPVCNACSVYFREKKICSVCGKKAFRATRLGKSGTGAWLCPSCYGKARGHASCPQCGRHRMLQETEHGAMCKKMCYRGVYKLHNLPCPNTRRERKKM
ncbi:peptide maturation protein PmbA [Neisseria shayeganii 871]|uniref:Peptide maturation protein PmbA n=1 Tax=Neisseria shayeganii 871 TaxID=1032488 RepID=G4CFY9_9NEIS|nr:peptide maturation protein PmbA [Neisseria shayeganii 871]